MVFHVAAICLGVMFYGALTLFALALAIGMLWVIVDGIVGLLDLAGQFPWTAITLTLFLAGWLSSRYCDRHGWRPGGLPMATPTEEFDASDPDDWPVLDEGDDPDGDPVVIERVDLPEPFRSDLRPEQFVDPAPGDRRDDIR